MEKLRYFVLNINNHKGDFMMIKMIEYLKETKLLIEGFWNYLCVWEADESGLICGKLGLT